MGKNNFINCLVDDITVSTVTFIIECCPLQNSVNSTAVTQITIEVF